MKMKSKINSRFLRQSRDYFENYKNLRGKNEGNSRDNNLDIGRILNPVRSNREDRDSTSDNHNSVGSALDAGEEE